MRAFSHHRRIWGIAVLIVLGVVSPRIVHGRTGVAAEFARTLPYGRVVTEWRTPLPDRYAQEFEALVSRTFRGMADERTFALGMRRILAFLAGNGYREATLAPRDFEICDDGLTFSILADPGPRYRVAGFRFSGVNQADTLWLQNLMPRPLGAPLTAQWLRDATRRLDRITFLRVVSEPRLIVSSRDPGAGAADVIVAWEIQEQRPARIDGFLATGGNTADPGLTGRASLRFGGLFGRDRSVTFKYQRLNPRWSTLDFDFSEVGAFRGMLDWQLDFDQSSQYDRRQTLHAGLTLRVRRMTGWRIGVTALWRKIAPAENPITPARLLEGSLRIGHGEVAAYPTAVARSGMGIALTATGSRRRWFPANAAVASDDRLRLDGLVGATRMIGRLWTLKLSLAGRWWAIQDKPLGPGDEWYLGGANRLRGYGEQAFTAAAGVWGNLEIEYRLATGLSIAAFSEVARLSPMRGLGSGGHDQSAPYGFGVALGLWSPVRVGRLEIAWPGGSVWREGVIRLRVSQAW